MKVGFIGVGKLGMPCAEVIASKGHEVYGFDVAKRASDLVQIKPSIQECVEDRDIVFIAVPTPHDPDYDGRAPTNHLPPKDFSYTVVEQVLKEANQWMNKDQLLVLISTVLPGTVRREFAPLVENTRFVYNPYLIAMGSVAWDMVNPEMVMIGTDDGSETGDARQLVDFYETIMENNPRYVIGTWDECECIKVFYNTFISAKIGLVNMIQDVAERQGNINVDVVTEALAHSDKRIMGPQYMKAGMGDGGACHPRDNIALRWLSNELGLGYDLFGSIMYARERQAKNLADYILYYAQGEGLPVYIHGKAYKPGVEYCDGSYSLLIGSFIEAAGVKVTYIDPLTGDNNQPLERCIILLAHSASTTYKYMQEEGDSTDKLYCNIPNRSIVIDPWRSYTNENVTVLYYGNTRQGKLHCMV